jgi:hypothetical protein
MIVTSHARKTSAFLIIGILSLNCLGATRKRCARNDGLPRKLLSKP